MEKLVFSFPKPVALIGDWGCIGVPLGRNIDSHIPVKTKFSPCARPVCVCFRSMIFACLWKFRSRGMGRQVGYGSVELERRGLGTLAISLRHLRLGKL